MSGKTNHDKLDRDDVRALLSSPLKKRGGLPVELGLELSLPRRHVHYPLKEGKG